MNKRNKTTATKFFNMKTKAKVIDHKDAERFGDYTNIIFNYKNGYCLLNHKAKNYNPKLLIIVYISTVGND